MSDTNQSEIVAAADVVLRWDGEFDGGTTRQAAQRLAKWALARLAADRAEREHVVTTGMLAEIRESLERLQGKRQCGNCGRAVIDPLCPHCWQGEDYDIPVETLLSIVCELIDRRERAGEGGDE